MRKVLKVTDIDCAHCAAAMEKGIGKIPGVTYASVNFLTQKIIMEYEDTVDFEELLPLVKKAVKKVDNDCDVIA
ncbi:MAG: heavy-metal-associated domain-containing protein [Clostridia bacterium]|nr:heavy-metal-associated domain-containing protein [Clostridia bacterium]